MFTASLVASLLAASCGSPPKPEVPYYNDASFTPSWDIPAAAEGHHVGAFRFRDQSGQPFGSGQLAGKIYLANFFFTSCKGICPKMQVNMNAVSTHFAKNKDIFFLSHSVTPEIDSVPRLRQYAAENNIKGGQWRLLTGTANDIYRMARTEYFIEEAEGLSKDSTEFLHTENMVLVDRHGRIRGIYNGTIPSEVPRIITDINALIRER